jgi:translation initiation factor 2-alpha kinase 3
MLVPRSTGPRQTVPPELDAVLFIKMEIYPLTLEDLFWSEEKGKAKELNLKYCFHISAAIQILSTILDGVEYVHSQGMVHRDLKPGNILLSVHNGSKYSSAGSIDVSSCSECGNSPAGQHTFITPHIGDFGLVAEIRKPQADSARTPRGEHVFEPTELARLAPAGSRFYTPQAPVDVICPKLDVYSLGVVTFELLYKFSTKSERMIVLEKLKMGEFPKDFEDHKMAAGIKAMICGSRDERWTCTDIRNWLQDAKERHRRY